MNPWWIFFAIFHSLVVAQRCSVTYFDQRGYFPLVIEKVPPERCPTDNDCCWCSFGNKQSDTAWCCVSIACNAVGIEPFESFTESVCTANVGITSKGEIRPCPPLGTQLQSLTLMTLVTAEATGVVGAASPTPSTAGQATSSEDSAKPINTTQPSMASRRKLAIAVSSSLVGFSIIVLALIILWHRKRAARLRQGDDIHSKISELPTDANTHEIEGTAMEKIPLNASSHDPRVRNAYDSSATNVRIITPQRQRLNDDTPLSSTALLPNWSPVISELGDDRISTVLVDKPLPPPPMLKYPKVPPKDRASGKRHQSRAKEEESKDPRGV